MDPVFDANNLDTDHIGEDMLMSGVHFKVEIIEDDEILDFDNQDHNGFGDQFNERSFQYGGQFNENDFVVDDYFDPLQVNKELKRTALW